MRTLQLSSVARYSTELNFTGERRRIFSFNRPGRTSRRTVVARFGIKSTACRSRRTWSKKCFNSVIVFNNFVNIKALTNNQNTTLTSNTCLQHNWNIICIQNTIWNRKWKSKYMWKLFCLRFLKSNSKETHTCNKKCHLDLLFTLVSWFCVVAIDKSEISNNDISHRSDRVFFFCDGRIRTW